MIFIKPSLTLILMWFVGFGTMSWSQTAVKVAAYKFSIEPKVGTTAPSRKEHVIENVYGDLKNTLLLVEQDGQKVAFITSPLDVIGHMHQETVAILSKALGLPTDQIVTCTSHSHTVPVLHMSDAVKYAKGSPDALSRELGREFEKKLIQAAAHVSKSLVPVTIEWGNAEENRITYNRRGKYVNGKSYFIREEDRLPLGEGYRGLIDPDATVVLFKNTSGKYIAGLTFFTGHPVTAYSPEKMFSHGQFPQIATERLAKQLGDIPIGFVQGCAGDINSKYMLTGTIKDADLMGEYLAEAFLVAAKNLHKSQRIDFRWSREEVHVPFAKLPPVDSLKKDLAAIDDFMRRGNNGDENTLYCVGMNFPQALTPPYRARLVEMVRPWYLWALEQYAQKKENSQPPYLTMKIFVARIGDVGFVGLPYEPFVKTGLKIKNETNLPCIITGGYIDGVYGYIPDASACDDREYQAGFFRYMGNIPPYAAPGGDVCADVAVKKLTAFATQ